MSLLQDFYVNDTGEIRLDPAHTITHRITPAPRRPDAGDLPETERVAFAVLTDSGELPLAFIETPRPRPEETARIVTGSNWPGLIPEAVPSRPWFYRGTHRWTRSLALLTAATWPGGAR